MNVASPLVPGAAARLVANYDARWIAEEWRRRFGIVVWKEFADFERITLYRCQASGLDFFEPAKAAATADLYRQLQRFSWYYLRDKWEYHQAIDDLEGCERLLEIGSGQGHFLKLIQGSSLLCQPLGIDHNSDAIRKSVENGLPAKCMDLEDLSATETVYDAVCAFQVLEHVADPLSFLQSVIEVLAKGGKFLVSLPNRDSVLFANQSLLDLPPHHMTRWSTSVLRYLEQIFPLRVVKILREPLADYHIADYLSGRAVTMKRNLPGGRIVITEARLKPIADIIRLTGFNRVLTGHSIYAVFEKIE